jgi:D-alanine-D-alanine ligase
MNVQAFGKVAVLYGGLSSERPISLKSGKAVFDALIRQGCDAELVDVDVDFIEQLANRRSGIDAWDCAFIVLHGVGGEDGVIQAALQLAGIPYTGSGVLASALGMDKWRTKQVWQAQGLATPAYVLLNEGTDWQASMKKLGDVAIVKPACEGSSMGMRKVDSADSLRDAYYFASDFAGAVLAETWVSGPEYTVGILDGNALPVIRLVTGREFYDFEAKYLSDSTQYLCPCGLEPAKEAELQQLAISAFDAVGCKGWGRVDVMSNEKGEFFLLEVNTVPGMTDHSLVPMAAKVSGLDFDHLVLAILAGARS